MWPEIEKAKSENRHEIQLSGKEVSERIAKDGLDSSVFDLTIINYLTITKTCLTTIPDAIGRLLNLQILILHTNKLEEVNENISKLEKLRTLDLSRNRIKTIPDSFANLLQLVTLNISSNELEAFPALSKNKKLASLDLSDNKLKSFPDVCSEELACLSDLNLHKNEIEEIPNNIRLLPSLKNLDISLNRIKVIPGELADCPKLKEVNLNDNLIIDNRLSKLIRQTPSRSKQILDYIKQHCQRTTTTSEGTTSKKNKKGKNKHGDEVEDEDDKADYKYTINVKHPNEDFKVVVMNNVRNIREHFVACIVTNITLTQESLKKFIQLQNKLHESACDRRNTATIATHDFNKFPPGNLTYTTSYPSELIMKPLNRTSTMTGAELFSKLQVEANNLRKEKKRNTYSGIHKYLYLIEGKPQYPCLLTETKEVISFPPITNSDISKIESGTNKIFIEVTSSISQHVCKTVLNTLLKDMCFVFDKDLEVQQVKTIDQDQQLKIVYPSKTDLIFDKTVPIKVVRE